MEKAKTTVKSCKKVNYPSFSSEVPCNFCMFQSRHCTTVR